jgi:sterol desaturase/sphingolipid hydroxylase (fatty acid hydroxylase superfamily)
MLHSEINTLYQFWIHTQTIGKFPFILEYIFNTPSHHRVHHGCNPQYIDKNYGGTLIIFDRIFGTFEPEKEEVRERREKREERRTARVTPLLIHSGCLRNHS